MQEHHEYSPLEESKLMALVDELQLDTPDILLEYRLRQELMPVIAKYKELLAEAIEALLTKDKEALEVVIGKVLQAFEEAGCDMKWDFGLADDNEASLAYDESSNRWILKRSFVLEAKTGSTLRAYLHELVALEMLKARHEAATRAGRELPQLEQSKMELMLGYSQTLKQAIALTHVFDHLVMRLSQLPD